MWFATHQKRNNYLFDTQSIGKECNMEMCYDGALVMPNNYVAISEEEMTYIDGGLTNGQKAIVVAACAVGAVAICAAVTAGEIWVAAKILGWSMSVIVEEIGAAAFVGLLTANLGIGGTAAWAITYFFIS